MCIKGKYACRRYKWLCVASLQNFKIKEDENKIRLYFPAISKSSHVRSAGWMEKNVKSSSLMRREGWVLADSSLVLLVWMYLGFWQSSASIKQGSHMIYSFEPFNSLEVILLEPFYRWENQSTERTSNFLKINFKTSYQWSHHVTTGILTPEPMHYTSRSSCLQWHPADLGNWIYTITVSMAEEAGWEVGWV